MSLNSATCVTVLCEGCGPDWWEGGEEGYVPHFPTAEAALKDAIIAGWRVEETIQLCPDCAAKQDCARNGHQMMEWQTCWCQYNVDAGEPTCGHLWRQCGHCQGAYERRSFDVISTL